MKNHKMSHRARVENCLANGLMDHPPVTLWRHFPVDDQKPDRLASAILSFQHTYDWDLVKVTPASSFCVKDWGVRDEWRGDTEGTRAYTKYVVQNPEDWEKLAVLDPKRGFLAEQLNCLDFLLKELNAHTPVIQTIFSPLSQAKNLASRETLILHLRRYPEALHIGLNTIAESTQLFIEAAIKTGISGVFYAVQHAQYSLLTINEYLEFGKEYDLGVLEAASGLWVNMLHIHGSEIMFDLFQDYPVAIINWHDKDTPPSLKEGQTRFKGAVCGGLQRERTLVLGTPERVRKEAIEAIHMTDGKRFILGTGCVVPITCPHGNLFAVRKSVEQ